MAVAAHVPSACFACTMHALRAMVHVFLCSYQLACNMQLLLYMYDKQGAHIASPVCALLL